MVFEFVKRRERGGEGEWGAVGNLKRLAGRIQNPKER